jgi:hypothetical protein
VPDALDERSRDEPELGRLLDLLHRADAPFVTVQATYRIWRHDERAAAAWRAEIEEQKRRGASISTFQLSSGSPAPAEHEEVLRIWRAGNRVREEHQGGSRDGSYGVRTADLWWSWDERNGAHSNEDDPTVGSGIGEELAVMLDPTPLLGALQFAVAGRSEVAGRATITAVAAPRPSDPRRRPRAFELHQLGSGADRYTLQVDAERGVLLEVVALRDNKPFHKIATVEIVFEDTIPDERFHFQPPAGEETRPVGQRTRPQHLSLPEAQQRAPFIVLIPDRIPPGWHSQCSFIEPSARPPSAACVSLNYHSDDGHESVSLSEYAAGEKPDQYDLMIRHGGWRTITRDATDVAVRTPGGPSSQNQAYIEREGTFAFLISETLTGDQLATLAAGLKPAPSTSSI